MKRLSKVLLIGCAVLVLIVLGALAGLGGYVGSENGRARIEAELDKALGLPLQIQHASLGWSGIRITGASITVNGETFLSAPSFTTEYRLLPLFQRQVVLHKMILDSPKIVWPQNSEGKWVWPARPKAPKTEEPPKPKVEVDRVDRFQLALDTLEVTNGSIELLDQKGQPFLRAPSVHGHVDLGTAKEASGEATATTVALLQNGPVFEDVHLPFHLAGEKLTCANFHATLGGGAVQGSLGVDTKKSDNPFDLQLSLENVELARAATDPDWKIHSGRLRAALDLHASSRDAERGLGRGEIHVSEASVDALEPLLRLIGESCHIPELASLRLSLQTNLISFAQALGVPDTISLRQIDAVFQMGPKETTMERFVVDAGDLGVEAKGVISKDGKLNLDSNLNVSESLARKLPTFVRDSLVASNTGRRGMDFHITGKSDRPKTDLVDKLIGTKIDDQFKDVVSSIFGPRKQSDADKEKERQKAEKAERREQKKKEKDAKAATDGQPPADAAGNPPPGAPATPPATPAPAKAPATPPPAPAAPPAP